MAQAAAEGRIILTEDKDFGWLAFVKGVKAGVILIRWPSTARLGMVRAVGELAQLEPERIAGCFTVVQPGRIRVTRLPS